MTRPYVTQKLAAFALFVAIGAVVGAKTDTARAQSSSPAPFQKYDGTYTGYLTLNTIQYDKVFGGSHVNFPESHVIVPNTPCRLVDARRNLTIKNATVHFLSPHNNDMTGTVSNDGVIAASGTAFSGFIRLNARIHGTRLVGEFVGPYCTFTLQMEKE
jgi:phage baseplate assembly protein gpV